MRLLIYLMIVLGSALMVYNIIRYGMFVRSSDALEHGSRRSGLLIVPLLLLIFFLVGYIVVGISGAADIMVAAILFGGSVFVFLLLWVMFAIVGRIRDTEQVLAARYEDMKEELSALTEDSLAVFRVDLTRDEVEERAGVSLSELDNTLERYSELLAVRSARLVEPEQAAAFRNLFHRDELLRRYQAGQTRVEQVAMVRREGEAPAFVQVEAMLTEKPVTGDVVAFINERPYNEEMVQRTLLEQVLTEQYDRIAYLIDGRYRVLISNDGKKGGLLLPADKESTYEELYLNYILPAMPKDRDKSLDRQNPLRLSRIDEALASEPVYNVNAPFVIDGETRYKHFLFCRVNRAAKFYLMLLADSTALQEEQTRRARELSDALAEAVRANQARVRFFTNVSHDLRTPMTGILGFTSLAREENDPARIREYLERVDVSGRQLMSFMDDLLAMSLLDSGALTLHAVPTDLRALTEALGRRFAETRPEKALTVVADTDGLREPRVLCAGEQLENVLSRLLENACFFSPPGETVTVAAVQTGDDTYTFSVRNKGTIPPEVLDRIFESDVWERDENPAEDLPGVSLGMTLAQEYIRRMGGTVEVTSDPESGTAFLIRFTFEPAPPEPAPAEPEPAALPGEKLNILLVDDNEINREIARLLLTAEGWTVEQAVNGAEAVDKIASSEPGRFDLVLMDVQMPVMNGYEATAKIRALEDKALASIPIIALTANAYQEDSNEALAAGMDDYTSKPIDPEALRKTIARLLSR